MSEIKSPYNPPPFPSPAKITAVYAYVVTGPNGQEGIPAFRDELGQEQPLIGFSRQDRDYLQKIAARLSVETGLPMTLYRYSHRERIERTGDVS